MKMTMSVLLRLFAAAVRAWWDDDCTRLGASLAYYTLFAIAPILLVATAIAGMVFGAEAVRGEIVGQLDHLVGREGALAVQSLLEGASQRRAGMLRHRARRHHLRRRRHRRVPRAASGAEHDLAGEAQTGRALHGVRGRSAALVRPGGGDRLSAAGLARGDRRAGGAQRLAVSTYSPASCRCSGTPSARWSRWW